jgi:hypothetical protein
MDDGPVISIIDNHRMGAVFILTPQSDVLFHVDDDNHHMGLVRTCWFTPAHSRTVKFTMQYVTEPKQSPSRHTENARFQVQGLLEPLLSTPKLTDNCTQINHL